MNKNSKGQSLFEIVMALAISTLIITALVILAANAVKNSIYARNKTQATRYSQEATEWLRGERDKDWATVYAKSTVDNSATCGAEYPSCFCFADLSWTSSTIGKCSDGAEINSTIFKREIYFNRSTVTISGIDKTILGMLVKVYWVDPQGIHDVRSATSFTDWRER